MAPKPIIDPSERFGKELGPDEEVIWIGHPVSQIAHAKSAKLWLGRAAICNFLDHFCRI